METSNRLIRFAGLVVVFLLVIASTSLIVYGRASVKRLYIDKIQIVKEADEVMIGSGHIRLYAVVHMSDGTIARKDNNAVVDWRITDREDNTCACFIDENGKIDDDPSSDYYGSYYTTISAPYGMEEHFYRITAQSVAEPVVDRVVHVYFRTNKDDPTFFKTSKGSVKVGSITGNGPTIKEQYGRETDTYSLTVPKSTFKSRYYDFAGWKVGNDILKPGMKYTLPATSKSRTLVAQWKAKFKAPHVVVSKYKNDIYMDWGRIVGANGYIIYRATSINGKYKKVDYFGYNGARFWLDTKVKKGKTYYYRIAAYRYENGKRVLKKSEWVKMGAGVKNVKAVKVSRSSVAGKVGKRIKLKGKVIFYKGKVKKKGLRWYSSNKAIAKVGKKTGKLILKKEGICYVWAKAYNGRNSKKIKVVVR